MSATTAQPATARPGSTQPETPEGPVASDARLRDAILQWPDTVANPRRIRVR